MDRKSPALIVDRFSHYFLRCFSIALVHVWTAPWVQEKMRNLTGGSIAIMCPASHEGIRVKLFHRGLLHVYSSWLRISLQSKAELSSQAGHFPANLTSGGTTSPPRSRIRDGRAPGGWQPLCETAAYAPGRTTATPPWIRVPVPLSGAGSIREVNQDTDFITAPSGTTPWVANR